MTTDPNSLIGTHSPAPLQAWMLQRSAQSYAYASGLPYPQYAFGPIQWPRRKGPVPTAVPVPQMIIAEGADFLFRGGPPKFSVPYEETPALQSANDFLLKSVIQANRLEEQWVALAEACGNLGAIAAKFSIDAEDKKRPVRINFLDVPGQCRVWFDPHDSQVPIFARIQYPYRDVMTGDWYYYREEWTEDYQVTYQPLLAGKRDEAASPEALPGYLTHLGDEGHWQEDERLPNVFEVIPVTILRNRRVHGNPLGEGDLWHWFRIVDRIALTLHESDYWNQNTSRPRLAATNADMGQDDDDPLPGEFLDIRNENPNGPPADIKLLEPMGYARQWVDNYVTRMEKYAWEAAGYSHIDLEAIANKGAWTQLAFEVTYAKTISTTGKKRELWGNSGLCVFFRNCLQALARVGGFSDLTAVDDETEVSCAWMPFFQPTDQDKGQITERTITQVAANFLTPERGARRVAMVEGIPDHEIQDLLDELEEEEAEREQEQAAAQAGQVPGDPAIGAPQIKAVGDTRKVSETISPASLQPDEAKGGRLHDGAVRGNK